MICLVLFFIASLPESWPTPLESPVDYTGHKVVTVRPSNERQYEFIKELENKHKLDLWNEPKVIGAPIMIRLHPETIEEVEKRLREANISYTISISNLQSVIESEKIENALTYRRYKRDFDNEDFGKYRTLSEVNEFLHSISLCHSNIATIINIGNTSEGRPIMGAKIGSNGTNPVILIDCGVHAREWIAVSSCLYTINELTSKYATNDTINALVTNYQWYIIPSSNPDGYLYSWSSDRMWRKTRSRSRRPVSSYCKGADANRNFDVKHCEIRSGRRPCENTYCGDSPFSEKEARALRDLILNLGSRIKAYFSIHSFSQLWLFPYGYKKDKATNHEDLMRICKAGTDAIRGVYGITFKCGTIFHKLYPVSGTSVDWAYEKAGVKNVFALELRDTGRYGFMLPRHLILPTCKETFAGLSAAVNALN